MSRTKKFALSTLSTGLMQIISIIAGLIIPRVMLTTYGSEINGLVTSINQYVVYITLVEIGLGSAVIYSLYKPLSETNYNEVNGILVAAKNFYNKAGLLFTFLIFIGALLYPIFIKIIVLTKVEIFFLVLIIGVGGVLEFFSLAKYRALLMADQKTYVISFANIIQIIINSTIVLVLSFLSVNIVIVKLVALLSIFIRTVILWVYCKIKYSFIDLSVLPNHSALSKRWDALYVEVLVVFQTGTPIMLATIFLTLNDVSVFSIYNIVVYGITTILSIFKLGFVSAFGNIIAKGEKEVFKRSLQDFELVHFFLVTILFSVSVFLFQPFIDLYTKGADIIYYVKFLALLMIVDGFVYQLKAPYSMLVSSKGMYRETRIQSTIQLVLLLLLGIIGIKLVGLIGIIIASIISNLYRTIDFAFFTPKYITGFSFKPALKKIIVSSIFLIISILINQLVFNSIPNSTFEWIMHAIILTLSMSLVLGFILFLTDKSAIISVFKRIKLLIVRKI